MYILSIESSCDEFSIAILKNKKVLTNIISSQIKDHKDFGGVVPELASRLHVQNFHWVLSQAIKEAQIDLKEINIVSYTKNPGLIGSLLIGKIVAETLANYLNVKLIEINHIEGHIYSSAIEDDFIFPVLSLVVSGGHTQIVLMKNDLDFNLIGETQDDAIGECYDKVARNLGLEYPGGPKIDNLHIGNELAFSFPIPKTENKFDFSFSGLKTFSLNIINSFKMKNETLNLEDFCSSFQKSAIEILISKLDLAIKEFNPKTISLAGGVSANKFLRKRFLEISNKYNIKSLIPSLKYCTDNAAMIGRVAFEYLKAESKNE